jgi:DNA end-binding protein Ku
MPRPIWKGYITFGLVNIPVILYPAEQKFDIQFKLLDSRNKSRIRYQRVNEDNEEVPWADVAKGYEYDENQYVMVSEDELKKIAGENTKTIDIENFVKKDSVNNMYYEKPYYLVPDKKGEKGYVILRDILQKTNKVGITKVIIHTRQYLAALMADGDALVLNLMRYDQELKKHKEFDLPGDNPKSYKVTPNELEIARKLVDSMTVKWSPEKYKDEYKATLEQYIDEKIHTKKPRAHMKEPGTLSKTNVVNFADLLKKSLNVKKTRTLRSPKNKAHNSKKPTKKAK